VRKFGKESNFTNGSLRRIAGRCCGSSESWRYFYPIISATAIQEAAEPGDRVL
jgi:hypothetical protein